MVVTNTPLRSWFRGQKGMSAAIRGTPRPTSWRRPVLETALPRVELPGGWWHLSILSPILGTSVLRLTVMSERMSMGMASAPDMGMRWRANPSSYSSVWLWPACLGEFGELNPARWMRRVVQGGI